VELILLAAASFVNRKVDRFHARFFQRTKLALALTVFAALLLASTALGARGESTESDALKTQRIGIWNFEDGFITNLNFRDDLNLSLYLINPEGAAIWELELSRPSKRKTVPSTFFANLVPSISWFANANLEFSKSSNLLLLWPNSTENQDPPCLLFRFEHGELKESIQLDLPHGYIVRLADFTTNDRILVLAKHPAAESGDELVFFDLSKPCELGVLKPVSVKFSSAPGLIGCLKFQPGTSDLWLSAGLYRSASYAPPLLVRLNPDSEDDLPLIQGSLLLKGLSPAHDSVTILLDSRQASGKAGVDPNNWWRISYSEKVAERPCSLRGEFKQIWDIGGGRTVALFRPLSGSGVLGDTRLILLSGNEYSTIATGVRFAACSPQGKTVAVVFRSSNRLEVYTLPRGTAT
jgi:hypothetical protein